MSDVVEFRGASVETQDPDDLVWKCDCGNCAFLIYASGAVECSDCGIFHDMYDASVQATLRQWVKKIEY